VSPPLLAPHLLLGLALALPVAPRGPLALLRRGLPRAAVQAATRRLDADPDHADSMAWLGAAWAASGQPADALGAFDLSAGSGWYEDEGVLAHADALRPFSPAAAAALHTERLRMGGLGDARTIRLHLDIIDDHRQAGDAAAAWGAAEEALAAFPRAPSVQAALAELCMDAGDLDRAGAHLWLSRRHGPVLRTLLAEGRLALLEGRPVDALVAARDAAEGRTTSLRRVALEAEALRQLGEPARAARLLSSERLRNTNAPEVLAVRLRVAADLGRTDETLALVPRAAIYPSLSPLLHDLGFIP
jgi:tetratricopeptide (TPR) repeat protein